MPISIKKRILVSIFWIATFLCGALVGHIRRASGSAEEMDARNFENTGENKITRSNTSVQEPRISIDVPTSGLSSSMLDLLNIKNPYERRMAMREKCRDSDIYQLRKLVEDLKSFPDTPSTRDYYLEVFGRMSLIDANLACAMALQLRSNSKYAAIEGIVGELAISNPYQVWNWVQKESVGLSKSKINSYLESISSHIIENGNLTTFKVLIATVKESDVRVALNAKMAGKLADVDEDAAKLYLRTMSNKDGKTYAVSQVAGVFATKEPIKAADWALTLNDADSKIALRKITAIWAENGNPLDVANWINTQTNTAKDSALDGAISGLARYLIDIDPTQGLKWLTTIEGGPSRDNNLAYYSQQFMGSSPDLSLQYAAQITDKNSKAAMQKKIYYQLIKQDSVAARNKILADANLGPTLKEELLR